MNGFELNEMKSEKKTDAMYKIDSIFIRKLEMYCNMNSIFSLTSPITSGMIGIFQHEFQLCKAITSTIFLE